MTREQTQCASRTAILKEARRLVGDKGTVTDYPCDCDPGGERFLVAWKGETMRLCFNIEELRENEG